jgi:filamentous hemagglutinin family protein
MKSPLSFFGSSSLIVLALNTLPVAAQIAPDGSLPTNVTSPDGLNFTIDNGALSGNNLFHSFQEFSIPTNGSAFFNNAAEVQNIFSRITGGNISHIDGLLRTNGGANLFLLNPVGIVFGPNARLNIGGSFFGTTANSIQFADGVEFSATNPSTSSLLTVSVPIGLQLGHNPGVIQVQGVGHRLTTAIPGVAPVTVSENVRGLEVQMGQTLALVGGTIELQGGILTAGGGHIELGSVRDATVTLNPTELGLSLDYADVSNWGKIVLSQRSLVNTGGVSAGSIRLHGGEISFDNSSLLWIQNLGTQPAGSIEVRASEFLHLDNSNPAIHDRNLASGLLSEAMNLGAGSDIVVTTVQLTIDRGGLILSGTFGAGRSGHLNVEGTDLIQVSGQLLTNMSFGGSRIATQTASSGDAGHVSVSTRELSVVDGGSVATLTSGLGTTGEVMVNADEIEISRGGSNIGSITLGKGNANQITLNTRTLEIREGGLLSSSSVGAGNSGSIVVRASESVEVENAPGSSLTTQIRSAVLVPSAAAQQVFRLSPTPTGTAGTIEIYTPSIKLAEGGQVSVRNEGTENAGNINLDANSIVLGGGSRITATTVSGEGGNIFARVRDLRLQDGSVIDTEAFGTGDGGNITIDSETITLLENSRTTANAFEGAGGNIQISTQGLFASPNSSITASSQFGVSGEVAITNPEADPSSGLVNLPQNVVDPSQQIGVGCKQAADSQFVATGRGGIPASPDATIQSSRIWDDLRDLPVWEDGEPIDAATVPAMPEPLVEATTWVRNDRGQVELVAMQQVGDRFSPTNCNPLANQPEMAEQQID